MRFLLSLCLLVAGTAAQAHEFWISPEAYMLAPGEEIKAELRVGEKFSGAGYPFVEKNFRRFELIQGAGAVPVEGRVGDRPALAQAAPGEGLVIIVHQTRDYMLTYQDWETFQAFTRHKDAEWAQARHLERGFTKDEVRERYGRYAKSLVAVGDGAGSDREVGLLTEVVALANPYTEHLAGGLPVRILHRGAPLADVQVEVFARDAGGEVEVALYRTDAEGVAVIDVTPGTEYLVDSVVMLEADPEATDGAPWETLWASLTFKLPAD